MRTIFLGTLIALLHPQGALAQAAEMQTIRGFAIDRTEVSIEQFANYVQATGTVTAAERAGGGSTYEAGWEQRKGWTWRTPFGMTASGKEPAVHINFQEARAYCQWAGKRLPSDSEWMEAAPTLNPQPKSSTPKMYQLTTLRNYKTTKTHSQPP